MVAIQQAYEELIAHLPFKWFKETRLTQAGPFHGLLMGLATAIASARGSIEAAREQAIPTTSSDVWLSLHLLGIGLERGADESDERALQRYQFEFSHTRNTREGLLRVLEFYSGLTSPQVRLETDFALNRFGALRAVLDAPEIDWESVSFDWLDRLRSHHIANGIQVSVDIELRCLRSIPFLAVDFLTPFPMGWPQLGPLYECPSFIDDKRLAVSRNQVAFISPSTWNEQAVRLSEIFNQVRTDGNPGAQYLYLKEGCEEGSECSPYICIDYLPETVSAETLQNSDRPFEIAGFDFYDTFPRCGAQTIIREQEVTIEIQGQEPTETFPASPQREDVTPDPNVLTDHVLIPEANSITTGVPGGKFSSVQIAANTFGRLDQFPYCAETITLPANEEIEIPDTLTLSYQETGETIEGGTEEYWRVKGNYHTIYYPETADVSLPNPADISLDPNPSAVAITFAENPPQIADFYEFEGYWFAYCVDEPRQFELPDTVTLGEVSYIPNVRAGFTRGEIVEFLEVISQEISTAEQSALDILAAGPWELTLGAGDIRWGETSPPGPPPAIAPIRTASPSSIWWINPIDNSKSAQPVVGLDKTALLAIEFLFETSQAEQIRELELSIGHPSPAPTPDLTATEVTEEVDVTPETAVSLGASTDEGEIQKLPVLDIADYRRMNINVAGNFGVIYKVQTKFSADEPISTTTLEAFRTGRSETGDPLRDQDYVVAA